MSAMLSLNQAVRCSAVTASQAQQELFLSELKRVGTQQEQLKKAVSEAIAFADANGGPLEIEHLKSFPANINTASKQPDGNIVQQQQQIQPAGKHVGVGIFQFGRSSTFGTVVTHH